MKTKPDKNHPHILTRDIPLRESHWLDREYKKGELVYLFYGSTYGCISKTGLACTFNPGEGPFVQLPKDAIAAL